MITWFKQVRPTIWAYRITLYYVAVVFEFCVIQYAVPRSDGSRIVLEFIGLVLLPAAVLAARFAKRQITAESVAEAQKSVEIVIEAALALATGFLLVDAKDIAFGKHTSFEDKVPEVSLVFILVFAVHTVWKSSSMFDNFVERAQDEILDEIRNQVNRSGDIADRLGKSAEQVEAARYPALAARVLGIKSAQDLRIQSDWGSAPDPHLSRISERSLDAFLAWIQTGINIRKRGGGEDGRQTWWRLMETYHREEVFDVTQMDVATNVRNFAMMLLLAIRNYLVGDDRVNPDEQPKSVKRVVLVNVSKFPPKDFYNFPDGVGIHRFYHEPEFFGTYRRALGMVTRHPGIKPVRIFLCAPEPEPQTAELTNESPSDAEVEAARRAAKTVGSDWPTKIADDCANMNFLPVPLTFSKPYTVKDRFEADATIPGSLEYLQKKVIKVFQELPMGVTRALIAPHSQWPLPEDANEGPTRRDYREASLRKSIFDTVHKCQAQSRAFRTEAEPLLRHGLTANSGPGHDADPASFKIQVEQAWSALVHRCLRYGTRGFSYAGDSHALYEKVCATRAAMVPSSDAMWLDEAVRPYQEQYWLYLEAVENAYREFEMCEKIAGQPLGSGPETRSNRTSLIAAQRTIAELVLTLLSRCQTIDSLDKYFEMITPYFAAADETKSSTGITLGSGENWLHRVLILLEAKLIYEDVNAHGPIPLWKLFANDLCGIADPWDAPTEALEKFRNVLSNRIRMYNPKEQSDAEVLNEFLLVGIEKNPMPAGAGPQKRHDAFRVDDVDWKALIGTYINEPFHTCRIKFDFVADPLEPKQGKALQLHVKWVRDAWEKGEGTTNDFQRDLGEAWKRRLEDEIATESADAAK